MRLIFLLMVALLTACCTTRPPIEIDREVTITETPRDTAVDIPQDSAQLKLLLQCTEDNALLIRKIYDKQGERSDISYEVTSGSNGDKLLTVDCKTDSLRLELELRDKTIETLRQSNIIKEVEIERQPPWWSVALQFLGAVFLMIAIYAIYRRFRN